LIAVLVLLYGATLSTLPVLTNEYVDYGGFFCTVAFYNLTPVSTVISVNAVFSIFTVIALAVFSNLKLYLFYRNSSAAKINANNPVEKTASNKRTKSNQNEDEFTFPPEAETKSKWTNERILMFKSLAVVFLVILGWFPLFLLIITEASSGLKTDTDFAHSAICFLLVSSALNPVAQLMINQSFKQEVISWFSKSPKAT
jgi:hypothetical protein